jgi:hypothetical protein
VFSSIKSRISQINKFKLRGIIYISISVVGLAVELFVLRQARTFLFVGYGLIIFIGLVFIIVLPRKN